MKNISIIVSLCFSISQCAAQVFTVQWEKSFGGSSYDDGYSFQQTPDGGYILAGDTYSNDGVVTGNHGQQDFWVIKLNSDLSIGWQKALGGSDDEVAYDIVSTGDGYIVAGETSSSDGDVTGQHGLSGKDMWIVKLNDFGVVQWQKAYGGTEYEQACAIEPTSDGGYIIAGLSESEDGDVTVNNGDADFWIVKVNSSGNIQWQKSYGGSGVDIAWTVKQTSEGGYIVAGRAGAADGDVLANYGSADIWVLKLSGTGSIEWQKSYGGSAGEQAQDILQTSDGGYIITGSSSSNDNDLTNNNGASDLWIIKTDASGSIEWQKSLGGSGYDYSGSILETADHGYIMTGMVDSDDGDVVGSHGESDAWVIKFNNSGIVQWTKTFGGTLSDIGYNLQLAPDGDYIMAGSSSSNDGDVSVNFGDLDFWIMKFKVEGGVGIPGKWAQAQCVISPNPVQAGFKINLGHAEATAYTVIITDIAGKEFLCQSYAGNSQVNMAGMMNGAYIVRVITQNTIYQERLVKIQ